MQVTYVAVGGEEEGNPGIAIITALQLIGQRTLQEVEEEDPRSRPEVMFRHAILR